MKVYLLKDADFERLFAEIDRDPRWGTQGGSSTVMNDAERRAHGEAHRFYNYVVRTWASKVRTGDGT